MTTESIDQVVAALKKVKKAIVVSHYNPDADAYGSSCALALALKEMGKEIICINETKLLDRYKFIPGTSAISNVIPQDLIQYDALIACDCGDAKRLGDNFQHQLSKHANIINIDHHVSNTMFGKINLIVPEVSSTCELVYRILTKLNYSCSKDVATCLLIGIYGDTGSFNYRSTTKDTFSIASSLVERGAEPAYIADHLTSKSLANVRIFSYAMSNLVFHANNRIAESCVTPEDFKKTNSSSDDTEGLVEEIRLIEGIEISVFIYWDGKLWKISMRSKGSSVDLSKVAGEFGGGGHKAAAAFRWKGELEELRKKAYQEAVGGTLSLAECRREFFFCRVAILD